MAGNTAKNSKNLVFSGTTTSSSSSMDHKLVESLPPTVCTSKAPKEKEVILHAVIDIDTDKDSADIMVADEKFNTSNKEKAIKDVSDGSGNHQAKDASPGSDTLTNPDRLKNPPEVEASILWFSDHTQINKKPATATTSPYTNSEMQRDVVGLIDELDQYASSSSSKPPQFNVKPASASSSSLPTQSLIQPPEVKLSSPWPRPQASFASPDRGSVLNIPFGVGPSTNGPLGVPPALRGHFHRGSVVNIPFGVESSANHPLVVLLPLWGHFHRGSVVNVPFGVESSVNYPLGVPPPLRGHFHRGSVVNVPFGVESSVSWVPPPSWGHFQNTSYSFNSNFPAHAGSMNHPPGYTLGVQPLLWGHFQDGGRNTSYSFNSNFPAQAGSLNHRPGFEPPMSLGQVHSNHPPVKSSFYSPFELNSSSEMNGIRNDIMRKFELFKQFDSVQDYSDHHHTYTCFSMSKPSKNWAKRIQEEWKILEKDLPDTIFVRVYEERIEFLRAVIVGAEGTPYHDGLFFFDVFFPCGYPNQPPHVHSHSGGIELNPNLLPGGRVCISLLSPWQGDKNVVWNETWIPGKSTMLQVLVSIQGLVLNQRPFFNEPMREHMSGKRHGEKISRQYNENAFILSLKAMSYTMRRPPKHFEDFVRGHFCKRAHDILRACKAYMDGSQVGEGRVQDVEVGNKSCSQKFKKNLARYVNMLVVDFTNMGAEHCEKFL